MNKHTPGPWKVSRSDKDGAEVKAIAEIAWCGVGAAYSMVSGVTQHIDAEECRANARLIAAAPELLAALEDLERTAGLAASHDDPARVAARAAIAKARGEP